MATKSMAQIEREWQAYIRKTKREATIKKRPIRITTLVQSRAVTIYNRQGKQIGGKARWGKWETWNDYQDDRLNLRAAVRNALKRLKEYRIGTVVYVRKVINGLPSPKDVYPIFEAKWGTDNLPFVQWKPNPVADRAKRLAKI